MRTPKLIALLLSALTLCSVGCSIPATVEEDPMSTAETVVEFLSTPEEGGTLYGITTQTLARGEKTTEVEAVAAPGFTFVKWSDGERTAVHRGKKYTEDTAIYAIFEESNDTTPTIYIETKNGREINSDYKTVSFTLTTENLPRRFSVTDATGQIKCRGNASMLWDKRSYTLRFDDKQRLCGLGEGKNRNWVLIANHCDQSLLRNYISFWLQEQLDGIEFTPDCRLVDLYINGDYRGNYLLAEKVTVGEGRIDITQPEDPSDLNADFLLELDNYASKSGDKGITWFTAAGYPYEVRGEDGITSARCDKIDEWVTNVWRTVESGTDREMQQVIDIDSAVDTYIASELTKNIDCGWSSFFLYRRDNKLYFGPEWDFDLALGNDERLDNGDYRYLYAGVERGFFQQNHWFIELMDREWFYERVCERWAELVDGGLIDRMVAELDRVYAISEASLVHNFERWPIFGQRLNQEPAHIRALSSVEEHVAYLRQWILDRAAWLDEEFRNS